MDRLFARILLLFVIGDLFSDTFQELTIRVNPQKIEVCEGVSVNINCIFKPQENYKVSWHYSKTPTSDCITDKINEDQSKENVYTWPVLKINSTKTTDSGWYYCKITQDIPVLKENCSDGAQVIVEANSNRTPGNETLNQTQNPTTVNSPTACTSAPATSTTTALDSIIFHQWWIWFALAVGIAVVVVSIVAIWILTHDSKEIIYENTKPPLESGRWMKKKTKTDICNMPPSKKFDTIKPLRKYDTYSNNRTQRL